MEKKIDVRFTEKKVDSSWKEQAAVNDNAAGAARPHSPETSKAFLGLVQSVGIQALIQLGAVPNPVTQQSEVNLELAKEAIDTLMSLRAKTEGNLSSEEKKFIDGLLSELQVKFAQSV